ncbi:hypothetical protein I7I50_00271 [Histoplasma capsulatum G186AR]|uniref:Uncharacterized protein n=1 Tax=Ajellomyces capsulatus TaxID=5037 RepID=A0A8H7YDN9_AJECA|nr:hypothetical protein I7I52_07539 [Histoplasma capsulatum]QSS72427.1 hypothetical protein I7I50_00271 [Histoplasma capsulatum G186AR]
MIAVYRFPVFSLFSGNFQRMSSLSLPNNKLSPRPYINSVVTLLGASAKRERMQEVNAGTPAES